MSKASLSGEALGEAGVFECETDSFHEAGTHSEGARAELRDKFRAHHDLKTRVEPASLSLQTASTPIAPGNGQARWLLYICRPRSRPFPSDCVRALEQLARLVEPALARARVVMSLKQLGQAAAGAALRRDQVLDSLFGEISAMGFDLAAISFVDEYRQKIEMIRGINVPPGWLHRAKYSLGSTGIMQHFYGKPVAETIEGWDDRFLREPFERFEHGSLIRRYVPIISGGKVVAVLQAGCDIARKDGVFQPENIAQLERATAKLADQIAEIRPHVFLERIAARAADIAGAESSTVHIYRGTEIIVQAGTGRAEPKFVSGNQPRPDGLGMSARKMGMPQPAAGRALEEKNPALWTAGVRSIAAVALSLGEGEAFGLLFVHRWTDDRAFTPWELEILRVFAGLMEVALTDNFFLEIAKRQADEAWKMFQLQGVLGALGSQAPKSTVLEEVARNALLMFDADNVTLYEFIQDTRTFQCPPVMKGSFWHKEEMQGQVKPTDRLWGFVDAPESQFLEFGEPNRLAPSGKAERDPFVVREAIRASAVIQLRTPDPNEMVGLLFVNFRDARNFSEADKTAIKVVGQSAAIAIRTARLQEAARGDALRRKKQCEFSASLRRTVKIVNSRPDQAAAAILAIVSR